MKKGFMGADFLIIIAIFSVFIPLVGVAIFGILSIPEEKGNTGLTQEKEYCLGWEHHKGREVPIKCLKYFGISGDAINSLI